MFVLIPIGLGMLVLAWICLVRPVTGRQGNFSTSFFGVVLADWTRCGELADGGDPAAKRALGWCRMGLLVTAAGVVILLLG